MREVHSNPTPRDRDTGNRGVALDTISSASAACMGSLAFLKPQPSLLLAFIL